MKKYMGRKMVSSLLAVMLLWGMGTVALAEDATQGTGKGKDFSITGKVVAGESVSLTAPYGGKVLDYSLREGDVVQPGASPFTIDTTKVYAPCDGTVGGIRAQAGDEAAFIQDQYGALLYVEPASLLRIETNTSDSYNDNENKVIHVGETVYLKSVNSSARTGVGYVTKVSGSSYTVEVTEGNLRLAERAKIYRDAEYEDKSKIGSGKTARQNPVAITGEGSVLRVLVSEGQQVKRGDVLAEMVTGVLPGNTKLESTGVSSQSIVASIAVQPGQQVSEGEVLATLYPLNKVQIAADLNELDLGRVAVEDAVEVELDGMKEAGRIKGTIASISAKSHTDSGDAEYKVYVDFAVDGNVREGMSATVYIKE